ncbi:MAG: hypothetical protein IBX55_15180 [Methyloprofundus sp.]|nr:hypothetical protein [Methyloprofundus sp.]
MEKLIGLLFVALLIVLFFVFVPPGWILIALLVLVVFGLLYFFTKGSS